MTNSKMVCGAMDKAAEQSLRAGQIIRRLRDFVARGESERRVESINKLIEEASALALVGAKEHGVRVRLQVDPAHDLILADKVQIQQVLLNLFRNAIEAVTQGERRELLVSTQAIGRRHGRSVGRRYRPWHQRRRRTRNCFSLSSPPSHKAWAWAFPFRARSSRRMAARSGRSQIPAAAPFSNLRCGR